jgi:hypothetical protein
MSGGHFDYIQFRFEEVADAIDRLIANNKVKDEYGHSRDYDEKTLERFKETAHTIRRAAEMATRVDWLVSGDDGEENFHKRWDKEVRKP